MGYSPAAEHAMHAASASSAPAARRRSISPRPSVTITQSNQLSSLGHRIDSSLVSAFPLSFTYRDTFIFFHFINKQQTNNIYKFIIYLQIFFILRRNYIIWLKSTLFQIQIVLMNVFLIYITFV